MGTKGALPLGNLLILITPFIQGLRRDITLAIAPCKDSELNLKVLHNRLIFQRLKHRHVEQTGHIEQANFPCGESDEENRVTHIASRCHLDARNGVVPDQSG